MFGVQQRHHNGARRNAQESIDVIKMIWSDKEDFDYDGKYLPMKGIRGKPKPDGGTRPVIHDCLCCERRATLCHPQLRCLLFAGVADLARRDGAEGRSTPTEQAKQQGSGTRRQYGRRHHLPAQPARRRRTTIITASSSTPTGRRSTTSLRSRTSRRRTRRRRSFSRSARGYAQGMGGLPIVGDPDHVAAQLIDLSKAGLTGVAVSLVNSVRRASVLLRRGAAAAGARRSAGEALIHAGVLSREPGTPTAATIFSAVFLSLFRPSNPGFARERRAGIQ